MQNHSFLPEVGTDTFDGDAISRADRKFLASLSDHPLMREPLYSVPPRRGLITTHAPRSMTER